MAFMFLKYTTIQTKPWIPFLSLLSLVIWNLSHLWSCRMVILYYIWHIYMTKKLNIWARLGQLSHCIPVERVVDLKVGTRNQGDQWEFSCDFSCWELRESIPRQLEKKSRTPEKEKGIWGSQGGYRGLEI